MNLFFLILIVIVIKIQIYSSNRTQYKWLDIQRELAYFQKIQLWIKPHWIRVIWIVSLWKYIAIRADVLSCYINLYILINIQFFNTLSLSSKRYINLMLQKSKLISSLQQKIRRGVKRELSSAVWYAAWSCSATTHSSEKSGNDRKMLDNLRENVLLTFYPLY